MSRVRKGLFLSPAPPLPSSAPAPAFGGFLIPILVRGEQHAGDGVLVYGWSLRVWAPQTQQALGKLWVGTWARGGPGVLGDPGALGVLGTAPAMALWRQRRHTIFRGEGCSQLLPGQRLLLQPTMWLGERSPACLPPLPWGRGRQLPAPGAGGAGGLAPPACPRPGLTMPMGPAVPTASALPMPRGSTPAPLHGRSPLPAVGAARAPPQPSSRRCQAAVAEL